jgi:hypothetical protein
VRVVPASTAMNVDGDEEGGTPESYPWRARGSTPRAPAWRQRAASDTSALGRSNVRRTGVTQADPANPMSSRSAPAAPQSLQRKPPRGWRRG